MIGITATDVFPLNYPKGDTSLPDRGAKAVSSIADFSKDVHYSISLLQVQQSKFFGPLRCIWIDVSACTNDVVISINGTEQIFTAKAGSANYYPVVNLNVPLIDFVAHTGETGFARLLFLNFVPTESMPASSGSVIPNPLPITGSVNVDNFPDIQAVSGTVNTIPNNSSTNLGGNYVNSTTKVPLFPAGAISGFLTYLSVTNLSAVASAPFGFQLFNGNFSFLADFNFPALSGGEVFTIPIPDMMIACFNPYVSLTANFTSGNFQVFAGMNSI